MGHSFSSLLPLLLALTCSPLLFGVINKTKAFFAGRQGPPVLQLYFDLAKLFKKGVVYSQSTTVIFKMASVVTVATVVVVLCFVSLPSMPSLFAFEGDFIFALYLLAMGRFFLVTAALDTASSFEGMGASREVCYSALTEIAFFLVLIALAWHTQSLKLSKILTGLSSELWLKYAPAFVLLIIVLCLLLLIENARIPVDDPNTHLELTMIHEVMILDHSGPELALMLYASSLKLWLFSALIVDLSVSAIAIRPWLQGALIGLGFVVVAVVVGIVESTMARLKLNKVPQFIISAATLAALGLVMSII